MKKETIINKIEEKEAEEDSVLAEAADIDEA